MLWCSILLILIIITGWDDCSSHFDWIASLYAFLCSSNHKYCRDFSSSVSSSSRRILGPILFLSCSYLYHGVIRSCICHFLRNNFSSYCCSYRYRYFLCPLFYSELRQTYLSFDEVYRSLICVQHHMNI